MFIFHSYEVSKSAHLSLAKTRALAAPALEAAIQSSVLRDLDVEIRYVPIVMDADGRERYKARSRLEHRNRIYNCCPQLDIDPFLTGTDAERLTTYVNGLRESGPAIAKLGATQAQVTAFNAVLTDTLSKLVSMSF